MSVAESAHSLGSAAVSSTDSPCKSDATSSSRLCHTLERLQTLFQEPETFICQISATENESADSAVCDRAQEQSARPWAAP